MEEKQLVLLGDACVGKTCLIRRYTENVFFEDGKETKSHERHGPFEIEVEGRSYTLNIVDTSGKQQFVKLRRRCYDDTNLFVVCFSAIQPSSFQNVRDIWQEEIARVADVRAILVATKVDQRKDPATLRELKRDNVKPISAKKGLSMARKINAYAYVECSASTKEGIEEVFQEAVRATFLTAEPLKETRTFCSIV